jgi:hypothetical protein
MQPFLSLANQISAKAGSSKKEADTQVLIFKKSFKMPPAIKDLENSLIKLHLPKIRGYASCKKPCSVIKTLVDVLDLRISLVP